MLMRDGRGRGGVAAGDAKEVADDASGRRRGHDGGEHGNAGRGLEDGGGVGGGDATDAEAGEAAGLLDEPKAAGTDGFGVEAGFGAGGVHGPDAKVVRAGGGGELSIGGVVGGVPDDEAWRGEAAGGGYGEIVGAEVDAVGTGREGHVEAVVYDEGRAGGGGDRVEAGSGLRELACVGGLVAQLDCGRTGGDT